MLRVKGFVQINGKAEPQIQVLAGSLGFNLLRLPASHLVSQQEEIALNSLREQALESDSLD